jgi:hypothetical protein
MESEHLLMARRHVLRGREAVERQRQLVSARKVLGLDVGSSEDLLRTLERTLAIFEDDLQAALNETSPAGPV